MKTTFILLHGAWYGSWAWQKVRPRLQAAGNKVILIDYPNYIEGVSEEEIRLCTYVNEVVRSMRHLKNPAIIVGHSMSGIVLSQLAEDYSSNIRGLVYLSAFLLQNGESIYQFLEQHRKTELTGARKAIHFVEGDEGHYQVWQLDKATIADRFFHDCDTPFMLAKRLENVSMPLGPIRDRLQLTNGGYGSVPKYYIQTEQDRAIPFHEQNIMLRAAEMEPEFIYSLDTGHSPFLSQPGPLSELLLRIGKSL